MNHTKLPAIVSDDDLQGIALGYYTKEHVRKYHSAKELYNASFVATSKLRDIYEAARAKDAKLIQQLVNDLRRLRIEFGNQVGHTTQIGIASLAAAEAHGITPSDQ